MTGLHDAFDDIAAEITPNNPPLELTMRRGRKIRNGRLAAVIGGTAGAAVITVSAVLSVQALTGHQHTLAGTLQVVSPVQQQALPAATLVRPVLLMAAPGSATAHGDAHLVNAATLQLFNKLACQPSASAFTVNDNWKTALGYTAAQWNAPDSQVVSCNVGGAKYVLGPAVVLDSQVTSATPARDADSQQWTVRVTLDGAGTEAFGTLTTNQYNNYYPSSASDPDDAVLDQTAIVLNGDVQETPQTAGALTSGTFTLQGPQPQGFTQAEAEDFAASL